MNATGDDLDREATLVPRRSVLRLGLGAAASLALDTDASALGRVPDEASSGSAIGAPVGFADVIARAEALAGEPFQPAADDLPPALAGLTYDAYRAIHFRPEAGLLLGQRFSAQFFHRGFLFRRRVAVFVQGRERPLEAVAYDATQFSFGPGAERAQNADGGGWPADLGFAGFRLHHAFDPIRPRSQDEFLVFLGASYFRLRAAGQTYGLSARGVCVNTGGPGNEEFPDFTTFWINEPDEADDRLTVLALLEGPSLAGAFRFSVQPGDPSRLAVSASLHLRQDIARLGLAPLTSMFLYGESGFGSRDTSVADDFRPKVHDSDGLLVAVGAERTWRPLVNIRADPHTSAFAAKPLAGFGLLQRERDFAAFLDVQARYEARPGLWVRPRAKAGAASDVAAALDGAQPEDAFGAGTVQLYEIPTRNEYLDNIVAAFVPAEPARAGNVLALDYELTTVGGEPAPDFPDDLARVVRTRVGSAERLRPTNPPTPARRLFVIDFEGEKLPNDPTAGLAPVVSASAGSLIEPVIERVPQTGGWRLYVEFRAPIPRAVGDIVVKARLDLDGRPVTETWCAVA